MWVGRMPELPSDLPTSRSAQRALRLFARRRNGFEREVEPLILSHELGSAGSTPRVGFVLGAEFPGNRHPFGEKGVDYHERNRGRADPRLGIPIITTLASALRGDWPAETSTPVLAGRSLPR